MNIELSNLTRYVKNKYKSITLFNILEITIDCIQIIEKVQGLNGEQKKQIVMDTLRDLIDGDPGTVKLFEAYVLLDSFVSPAIDALVSASKGKLNINKVKKLCC